MNDERLSPNFTLREAFRSQMASRMSIINTTKDVVIIAAMRRVALEILEPVREHFGIPFSPSSFYRSNQLNYRLGGAANSQHCRGEAVDVEIPGVSNADIAVFIRDNLTFDKLIFGVLYYW